MDAGQIGLLIKVLNLLTGAVLVLYVGLYSAWTILSFIWCDENTTFADGGCQVAPGTGASFWDNRSAFIISIYMVPLGTILLVYEITTKRDAGREETVAPPGIGGKLASTQEKLQLYFGFIFFYRRRMQFLIFVGILVRSLVRCCDWFGIWLTVRQC